MKITLFTANNKRHTYLINLLSKVCKKLYVIQENNVILSDVIPKRYPSTQIMKNYFERVSKAQENYFGDCFLDKGSEVIEILKLSPGDINKYSLSKLENFLDSDFYIIFGGSYIKDPLANFLIKKRAINIHMGISPYYRGTDCNFWALFDDNPHLVGATIHMLSKGLDSGPILYHALSKVKTNPFDYTMSCVKSAFHSLKNRIENKSIFEIQPIKQNKNDQIRYTKKADFNENSVKEFLTKKINLDNIKFDQSLLKDPYFFKD